MADVDAVNERLNGLVTLLQAVGVGGDDVDRLGKSLGGGVGGGKDLGLPDARQLNDSQVEALIRKLQQAQAEAPQIIAALEAHAEARSLNGGGGGSGSRSGGGNRQQPQHQQQPQPVEEDDDDDEDDDDFDENANYPMVGHGCSDDISVVSDLTTPTVLTGVPVPEEEHYRDTLPPMVVGGGPGASAPPMVIQPTKRKNLVSQVRGPGGGGGGPSGAGSGIAPPRRNVPAPTSRVGGAAAARRKNYQETMAKLHENPHSMAYAGPSGVQTSSSGNLRKGPSRNKSVGSSGGVPNGTVKKTRVPRPTAADVGNFSELASSRATSSGGKNWNAFESGNSSPSPRPGRRLSTGVGIKGPAGGAGKTNVDTDGFLVGDSFDPFGAGAGGSSSGKSGNPFKSKSPDDFQASFSSSNGGFDAFGVANSGGAGPGPSGGQPTMRKPRPKPRPDGQARPSGQAAPAPRQKSQASHGRPRRARRASLAM